MSRAEAEDGGGVDQGAAGADGSCLLPTAGRAGS